VRERIRTGKNTAGLRELLNRIDDKIADRLLTNRKKVAVIFGETDEEYKVAQKKFGELSASVEHQPVAICAAKNGSMYQIPVNLMFKADIEDFGKSVGQPKHPFIKSIIENAQNITKKYVGDVDWSVKRISESDLATSVQYIFQAETGDMVEL
jgi:D-alanine-D-alanine ligase